MNIKVKRIKIAEACGWTFNPPCYNEQPYSDDLKAEALACWVRPNGDKWHTEYPPDYFNKLDDIHEAVESLRGTLAFDEWLNHLTDICGSLSSQIQSTAAERAEAFGLSMGLWKVGNEPDFKKMVLDDGLV